MVTITFFKKICAGCKNRGFTILFAVLVSSLVLALGIGIANITLKEIILSGTGRDSQFAFYAADTGTECALYWDFKGTDVFATSSGSVDGYSATGQPALNCVGNDIAKTSITGIGGSGNSTNAWKFMDSSVAAPGSTYATTTFQINFAEGTCAIVQVGKYDTKDGSGLACGGGTGRACDGVSDVTVIDSRGYNTCDTTNNRRLERGLRIAY